MLRTTAIIEVYTHIFVTFWPIASFLEQTSAESQRLFANLKKNHHNGHSWQFSCGRIKKLTPLIHGTG